MSDFKKELSEVKKTIIINLFNLMKSKSTVLFLIAILVFILCSILISFAKWLLLGWILFSVGIIILVGACIQFFPDVFEVIE